MAPFEIRTFGDPVLRQRASEITVFDDSLAQLAADMLVTMYEAPGVGLAAPQIGIRKRMFVFDVGDGPGAIINPRLDGHEGEWVYEEGCLSVPRLAWPIMRAKRVHLTGYDLDGEELSIEADELLARLFQHECDHLDGILLLERLQPDERKDALRILRQRALDLNS